MGPFQEPRGIIRGFNERIECVFVQGNQLYIGTATGNLSIHVLDESTDQKPASFRLSKTSKAIESLGYIKDISSLVVLVDGSVSLYNVPLSDPKPKSLPQTKGAICFATYSAVVQYDDRGKEMDGGVPSVVSMLAVGCRRRLVVFAWKDGEAMEVKENVLPHTPRAIQFFSHRGICIAYTATEHITLTLPHMAISEVVLPPAPSTSALGVSVGGIGKLGMGNLGGYLGMGGAVKKPFLVKINGKVLIPRENQSILVDSEGKATADSTVTWLATVEETVFVKPYLVSVFPPNALPNPLAISQTKEKEAEKSKEPVLYYNPAIQIRSTIHPTQYTQTSYFPFSSNSLPSAPTSTANPTATHTLRLLTPDASSTSYVVSTPIDKTAVANEGSTIWAMGMKKWGEQVEELIDEGLYDETLALLETLDVAVLPDKEDRTVQARTLLAVSQFKDGKYDIALKAFGELNTNPAKVMGLYPELVSGRLAVEKSRWLEAFGAKSKSPEVVEEPKGEDGKKDGEERAGEEASQTPPSEIGEAASSKKPEEPHDAEKLGRGAAALKTTLRAIEGYLPIPGRKDTGEESDDLKKEAALKEQIKQKPNEQLQKSLEALLQYLPDLRQKVLALTSAPVLPSQASSMEKSSAQALPSLSSIPLETLLSLPSVSPAQLTPEQLTTYAQVIDTALFKAYLVVRPGLIGPLCRIGNWCEVGEVSALLRAREKYVDLVSLYNGKVMHAEALKLLKELAAKQDDLEEKLEPSIRYLQKLGEEDMQLVFDSSRWILELDSKQGFQIFTSEDVELPRSKVADYLESIDPALAIQYIQFLIVERGENSGDFHDRLGLLLLRRTVAANKKGEKDAAKTSQDELLKFLDTTSVYRPERLFAALPGEGMNEARAILLGRMGRHEAALEIYVHRLKDYIKADEYCMRVYASNSPTQDVFLSLLKTFLRPQTQAQTSILPPLKPADTTILLKPALDLIARHSPRLDPFSTLDMLPALVTAQDVRQFLIEVLRVPKNDTMVVRELWKARKDDVEYQLAMKQAQRVKVTDVRICPQCHKRIGNSVIAVHFPGGEVTHYQCREAFSEQLRSGSIRT